MQIDYTRNDLTLNDVAEMLFRTGNYAASDFYMRCIKDWDLEVKGEKEKADDLELWAEALTRTLSDIHTIVEDLQTYIKTAKKLNRTDMLSYLEEISTEINNRI